MNLRCWLNYLSKWLDSKLVAQDSTTYPAARLLPRPTYRLLCRPEHYVSEGWVIRRTKGKSVFRASAGGRFILQDPKQLCDWPKHLSGGLSVNLWGRFTWLNSGWIPGPEENSKLGEYWQPPEAVKPPKPNEMQYSSINTWDVVGFSIADLNSYLFAVPGFGVFRATVFHLPTQVNYWHYEVRFQNDKGQWLHRLDEYSPKPYSNKLLKLMQEGLLVSFIQSGLAKMVGPAQAPIPLPRVSYDTQPPIWSRLIDRLTYK
jgi:hypothetical protein